MRIVLLIALLSGCASHGVGQSTGVYLERGGPLMNSATGLPVTARPGNQ